MRIDGLFPARVIAQYKDFYKVATEQAEFLAELSGRMRYASDDPMDVPSVGDFVLVDRQDDRDGYGIIHRIQPRTSVFVRRAAGTSHAIQVVAANIDFVFLCMSLGDDFNLRRMERYLAVAWDSGATPVIVLTKSDLCTPELLESRLQEVQSIAMGVDVLVTSSFQDGEQGWQSILPYLAEGRTIAFLGSSGVGKSTLINRLLGEDRIRTRAVRQDDEKGRHTTTHRELYQTPWGGAVIDTPGMREIGLENADVGRTFLEIDDLARQCRFQDCQHQGEPGCAVREAIASGTLSEERLLSYQKLKKEARYEGLSSRQIEEKKMESMYAAFDGIKNAQKYLKSRPKSKGR